MMRITAERQVVHPLSRPGPLNDLDKILRDVNAPAVFPTVFKPRGQFAAGVVIYDIDV